MKAKNIKNMKRFLKFALVFVLAASITQSCTDLEEDVFNEFAESNVDLTKLTTEQVDAALVGPYTNLFAMGSHNGFFSLNAVSTATHCISATFTYFPTLPELTDSLKPKEDADPKLDPE